MELPGSQVALLIDADNSEVTWIPSLLAEVEKLGEVMIGRVYGNWSLSSMSKWQEITQYYGLEQRHHGQTAPGKNATDIALVVDAMDILYNSTIDHFCLVTSDSDYTPLVWRLRSAGRKVLGIGRPTTPLTLRTACTLFVSTDQLSAKSRQPLPLQPPVVNVPVPSVFPTTVAAPVTTTLPLPTEPLTLLVQAYEEALQKEDKGDTEWVLLSSIGTVLKQSNAAFNPAVYGHKDLSSFVKAHSDCFETRRRGSKGKPVQVRRKHVS